MKELIAIGLVGLMAGCSTPLKRETYTINNLQIVCDTEEGINKSYQLYTFGLRPDDYVAGFHVKRKVYVRWSNRKDKDGKPIPDLESLGHEVWHEIKGDWHEYKKRPQHWGRVGGL